MNRYHRILFLFSLLCSFLQTQAQQVVWEKVYNILDDDGILDIKKTDSGYVAGGYMYSKGGAKPDPNGAVVYKPGAVLVRLTNLGDTIEIINLHSQGTLAAIEKHPAGGFWAAACITDTVLGSDVGIRMFRLSSQGRVLRRIDCPETFNMLEVRGMCVTHEGGALVIGSRESISGGLADGFAVCTDSTGRVLWQKRFTPSILTYLYHAELLNGADGFLVSGAAGATVWAAQLSPEGDMLNQNYYIGDPHYTALSLGWVMQSPDATLKVFASNSSTRFPRWYKASVTLNGQIQWKDSAHGGCVIPCVNSQGYIMLESFDSTGLYFRKYTPTGYSLAQITLTNDIIHQKAILSVAWTGNDSAVFAGESVLDRNNYRGDFYFVKMAHVGNPYITAVPALVAEKQPIALYPNPATNYFKISSANPGVITLFNAAGQNVLQQSVQPSEHVAISGLPQGLYMYRFVTAKGVSSGKVVRE